MKFYDFSVFQLHVRQPFDKAKVYGIKGYFYPHTLNSCIVSIYWQFLTKRKVEKLAIRQSLIEKKYTALAKGEELQLQMFQLLLRLESFEKTTGSKAGVKLKASLQDLLSTLEADTKRLAEISLDVPDSEMDIILQERIGFLAYQSTIMTSTEADVEWAETHLQKSTGEANGIVIDS